MRKGGLVVVVVERPLFGLMMLLQWNIAKRRGGRNIRLKKAEKKERGMKSSGGEWPHTLLPYRMCHKR